MDYAHFNKLNLKLKVGNTNNIFLRRCYKGKKREKGTHDTVSTAVVACVNCVTVKELDSKNALRLI